MCELFNQLKSKLSEHFPVPNRGIVAGQSVAQAYFDIKKIDIKTRYKDLDYFVPFVGEKDMGLLRGSESELAALWCSGVGEVTSIITKKGYIISASTYDFDTNINTVAVEFVGAESAKTIIDGFDINCAAIALDLTKEEVVIHPSFLKFIQSKELEFISIHTPISSFIRIVEKHVYIQGSLLNIEKVSRQVSLALDLRHMHKYNDGFVQGTGITVNRFKHLSKETIDTLCQYFFISYEDFEFSKQNEVKETFNGVIFRSANPLPLKEIMPRGSDIDIAWCLKNDLNVINNIIEKSFDKALYTAIEDLNCTHDTSTQVKHFMMPWLTTELLRGNAFKTDLTSLRSDSDLFDEYYNTSWLWEDGISIYNIDRFDSFHTFRTAFKVKNYCKPWSFKTHNDHLIREAKWCINAEIIDDDFAKEFMIGLHSTLKTPEQLTCSPTFSVWLYPCIQSVTSWQELLVVYPHENYRVLTNTWGLICSGDVIITTNKNRPLTITYHTPDKSKFIQQDRGVVFISCSLKVISHKVKGIYSNIKNKLIRRLNKHKRFEFDLDIDSEIPF